MTIGIDTYYRSDSDAYTVGVIFDSWTDKVPRQIISCKTSEFAPYIPGEFYKRELPCILDLLKLVDLEEVDTIILDGFLRLRDMEGHDKDGLGLHLKEVLGDRCPKLIGVAKTEFGKCHEISEEVVRGKAKVPLYVQGYGMSNEEAACLIKNMYGPYRIPDILKILDRETKKKEGL